MLLSFFKDAELFQQMKNLKASSRPDHSLVRDLAILASVALAAVAVGRFTPLFAYLFGWTSSLGAPEVRVGVLVSLLIAALGVLFWRRSRNRSADALDVLPPPHHAASDQASLTSFSEHNPHPILEADAQGQVFYANPAARMHFPDLEAQGAAHPVLHALPDLAELLQAAEPTPAVREVQVGATAYEQQATRVPGYNRLRLYLHDITRRKRTQEALRQSEEKFERVFRAAPMALSINRLADGRFVDVNDHFVQLLGYQNQRPIIGRTGAEIDMWVFPGNRAHLLHLLSQDDHHAQRYETQVYTADGQVRDVIVSIVVMEIHGEACVLSALLDVTEHREAEAGLGMLKAFYENTLRELPIQVAVLDDEARFIYLNPAAMRNEEIRLWMAGKTSVAYAEACGLDPEPFEKRHRWLLEVIARKEMSQLEETLTTHEGDERHLLRVAMPVLDEEGTVLYVVGYGIDMTERTVFEQQLVEAKSTAEEIARLKSSFVANMSHEVRTPLTAILGFAAVLREELTGEQRELAEIIKQSGERLLDTLNSVLDLARLEANAIPVEPKLLNLGDEILAAARLFGPMAEKKGLTFTLEMPDHKVRAQLDRAFLHRILSNLLSNAIKFTEEGEIRLVLEQQDKRVQLQVQDTGIGIDQSFQPHLYEEFKQESTGLDRSHTGSGLGLAITHHLIEQMYGRIEVASVKGVGSTFTVTFPISYPHAAGEAADAMDFDQLDLFDPTSTDEIQEPSSVSTRRP